MKMKLFKGLDEENFRMKILKQFYPETQEGFDRLASEMNNRINSHFCVQLKYNHLVESVTIVLSYVGYTTRLYCRCFMHENMRKTFNQIVNFFTAFACGLGYEC